MLDRELVPNLAGPVLVVLQDGRQLEGVLERFDGVLVLEGVRFAPWQVDDFAPMG